MVHCTQLTYEDEVQKQHFDFIDTVLFVTMCIAQYISYMLVSVYSEIMSISMRCKSRGSPNIQLIIAIKLQDRFHGS